VTALEQPNASDMRSTGHVPLRFLHTLSGNFTPLIQRKAVSTVLFPFSLKKLNLKSDHHGSERLQLR
jgi:hypothetical protein